MAQIYLDVDFRVVELVGEPILHDLDVIASWFLTVPAAFLVLDVPWRSSLILGRVVTDLIGDIRPETLRSLQFLLQVYHLPLKLALLRAGRRSVTLVQPLLEDKLRGTSESHPLAESGLAAVLEHLGQNRKC